jgi:formylmethanofuran dehydrogenase subunit D
MTYGETFQDIKPIDDYINFNIGFFNEFREYLKEKSELERKHAKESDTLIQKFSQRLDKKKQSLNLLLNAPNSIGAGNEGSVMSDSRPQTPTTHIPTMNSPQTPTTLSNEFKSKDYFSYIKAWSSLLNQMKENNNYRLKFCDKLGSTIDKMKTQIVIKEDEKKNYIQNLKNINNKIEEYVIEKNNAKKKYFDSCDLLGNQKKKLTRKDSTLSDVESSTDKSVKKIDGAQVDVDNKKNLYLLSLHSLNELKKKVHNEYIPDLFNNLQECQECIINAFQLYTQDYVRLEQKLTEDIKNNFNNALEDINIINSNNDNIVFENEKKEDIIPLEIEKFVRYFNEEGNYTITNKSSIYLSNLKDSLISQLTKDQEKFNISKSRFNNSKTHNHAYNINPSNVNCRSVMEEQTKLWNIVHMDEIPIVIKKSKIEVITGIIENEKLENPHDFKVQMFINAVCDYCHEKVRGNGLKCKSCSFICHKNKCESEVPKRCTGIKVDKKLIYSSVNNSQYILEEDTISDNSTIDESLNKLNESLNKNDDSTYSKEELGNKNEEQLVENNEPSNHTRDESLIARNMSLNKKIEKANSISDTSSIKRNESTNKKVKQLKQINTMKDESSIKRMESINSKEELSFKREEQLIKDDDELSDNSRDDLSIRRNISTSKKSEQSDSMREEVSIMNEKQSLKKYEEPDKKNEISNNDNISLDDKEKELKNKNNEVLLASASASSLSILSSNPPDEIPEKSPDTSFDMCAIFKFTPEQDDEVALSIGDQVKIIKQKSDGWVKVKTDHGEGYVPYNYIAPIKKALYSFNPENKDEIALKKGDSVVVLGQKEAGWVKVNIL